jgi:putative membrane protein
MHHCFRQQKFTDGIGGAVREVGTVLARHFPKTSTDTNELPDDVIES